MTVFLKFCMLTGHFDGTDCLRPVQTKNFEFVKPCSFIALKDSVIVMS